MNIMEDEIWNNEYLFKLFEWENKAEWIGTSSKGLGPGHEWGLIDLNILC